MIEIPAGLLAERERQSGEAGRRWVGALPELVATLCRDLQLMLEDRPVRHGANALVIDVRHDGEPCVLKVSWHAATFAQEATALLAWNGAVPPGCSPPAPATVPCSSSGSTRRGRCDRTSADSAPRRAGATGHAPGP